MDFNVLAPISGILWRLGNEFRELRVGDLVKKGEEIANIEAHKMQFIVTSPFDGEIISIKASLHSYVAKNDIIMILKKI